MIKNKIKLIIKILLFKYSPLLFPKLKISNNKDICVSTILYHNGINMTIYSLYSFFYNLGYSMPVVAFDDGTLTKKDIGKLKALFNIIFIKDTTATKHITRIFKNHPNFLKYRLDKNNPITKIKYDSYLIPNYKRIIFLESDTLFFNHINDINLWIKSRSNRFLHLAHDRKFFDSYQREDVDYSLRLILNAYKFKMVSPNFNTGLVAIPNKNVINLKRLDNIMKYFNKINYSKTHVAEETALSILLYNKPVKQLSGTEYACPVFDSEYGRIEKNKIKMIHYISYSKKYFARDAVKLTLKTMFFRNNILLKYFHI
jgi:hypothetical protein